jgi:hypothetical protein
VALGSAKHGTKLTISYSRASGNFSGKVTSPSSACIAGRAVTVYRSKAGKDPAIGSATSTGSGKWRVNPAANAVAGDYYATTRARKLAAGGGTCTAAKPVSTHVS